MHAALLTLALMAAPLEDAGEVLLIAGTGAACPAEVLAGAPLVLRLDGAELPAAIANAAQLELSVDVAPSREELLRLRTATSLHLVGDDALDWWKVFDDHGKRSALRVGLERARRGGADLVGWRAGAQALAGAWVAPRARLREDGFTARNPRRAEFELQVVGGLGLSPTGLYVVVEEERDLLEALSGLHRRRAWTALCVEGEVCWTWNEAQRTARLSGTGCAVLLEVDGARADKDALRGARLSLLRAGDGWDLELDRVLLAQEREEDPGPGGDELSPAHLSAALAAAHGTTLAVNVPVELRLAWEAGDARNGSLRRGRLTVAGLPRWPRPVRR